jgi:hypothetical protein
MINKHDIVDVLRNESFKEIIDNIIQSHIDIIINSDSDEDDKREAAYTRIRVTQELMAYLQSVVDSQKIEDARWKI